MGSLAFSASGPASGTHTPPPARQPARTSAPAADSETRKVLALLRRTLDRLPE